MLRISTYSLLLVLIASTTATAAESIHWSTDVRAAVEQASEQGRPILLFVSSSHCGYCTKMKRETYSNPAVAMQVNEAFIPVYVNADRSTELVRQLKVSAYPTTVVVSPESQVVAKIRGFVGPAKFQKRLATVLQEHRYAAR